MKDLNGVLDDQASTMGGELTDAGLKYRDVMVKILETETELQRLGQLDAGTQEALNQARDQETALYQKKLEAINAIKTPMEELISDMEFENSLMKMNNEERLFAIQTRGMEATAIAEHGEALKQLNEDAKQTQQSIEMMDGFRDSTRGLFSDFMDGSKSASDSFKDFVANILDGIA